MKLCYDLNFVFMVRIILNPNSNNHNILKMSNVTQENCQQLEKYSKIAEDLLENFR